VAPLEPHILPTAAEVRVTIEDVLAGKFKPPAGKDEEKKNAGETQNVAR